MPDATYRSQPRAEPSGGPEARANPEESVDPDALLSLLSDEYARSIVKTISGDPLPAREIAERLSLSRATVYRRLNRLEEAGVVRASLSYEPEGHHRKQFQTVLDHVVLSVNEGEINVSQGKGK